MLSVPPQSPGACGEYSRSRVGAVHTLAAVVALGLGVSTTMGLSMSLGTQTGKAAPTSGGTAAARRLATTLGVQSAAETYVKYRKTPALFESLTRKEWLAPSVNAVVEAAKRGEMHPALRKEAEGIYSLELFTEAFCRALLDEVDNYFETGLPVRRPNSMNNYGLIVNEIGMRPALTAFQHDVIAPIAALLFPDVGQSLTQHHSFMVQYRASEDPGLDMHTDDSDVTLNVCLGEDFQGAGLTFCGYVGDPDHRHHTFSYQHVKGRAVIHKGTRRHGADDITSGTRRNLIVWNHNLQYRASRAYSRRMYDYQPEASAPDPICLSYTHDRDYGLFQDYPPDKRRFAKNAWCPPPSACYDQMDDVLHTKFRGPASPKDHDR